jgi:hypothetical protein
VVRYIRKIVIPGTVEPILSPRDGSCHHETLSNSTMLNNMALEYITQLGAPTVEASAKHIRR